MKKITSIITILLGLSVLPLTAAEGNAAFQQNLQLAKTGDAKSQVYVALRYDQGRDGVEKNQEEALKWFLAAAKQGNTTGQAIAGARLQVKKGDDLIEAYKWLSLASDAGHANSKKALSNVTRKLKPAQLAEAKKRAAEFKPSSGK